MGRKWTNEEVEYLEKFYNRRGVGYIAKKLNRTENSIKRKAQRLGYNAYVCEELYLSTIAKCFHCDIAVIKRWIDKFGLPCRYIQRGQIKCGLVDGKKFWKWANNHKDIIPWSKYVKYTILPEPDWINVTLKEYKTKYHRKRITQQEKSYVIHQRELGHTFKEIAESIGRTEDAVKHIWRKRPIKKEN